MSSFVICGGKKLSGSVEISGSKNAALPIIFAAVTVNGVSVLKNVPRITDVDIAIELISDLGAKVVRAGNSVTIDTRELVYARPRTDLQSKIRASTYLLGATLARFGVAHVESFGGCNFEPRPIDMHIYAATRLGAKLEENTIFADRLIGADIYFDKVSVGATVNSIIMASVANGKTTIFNPAIEPHVLSLIAFYRKAGIKIETRVGSITVYGGNPQSSSIKIIPDMIEAGTFAALSIMTGSDFEIRGVNRGHLTEFFNPLIKSGAIVSLCADAFRIGGEISAPLNIVTAPYPAFPTDLQPIIAPIMLKYCGGRVTDTVWRGRFGYLNELAKFGGDFSLEDNSATLHKSHLHNATSVARDLRGGASQALVALSVEGESEIKEAQTVKRGYEDFIDKLASLGALIYEKS